jgi:hypothetical protein
VDTSDAEQLVLVLFENGEPSHAVGFAFLPHWFQTYLPTINNKVQKCDAKAF